ncbi:hypothetical protein ACEWY4_017018 [Coilia grayii]|uniref:Coiled-coil domain-containing protein 14 n=1 Tax=Coilia grayii TaxID=363190 RepID=A0ABD1JM08_9TELE
MADPGLGSHDPVASQMAPPLTAAAQWELIQTQARSLAYQQQQQQGSGASLQSSGQQGSTMFNCRLTTSTPVLGPHDTPTSQPCTSNPMQAHTVADAALQQFAQQWIMTPAPPPVAHGLLSSATTAHQLPPAQHPVLASMPASLCHLTPVTTAPPAAVTNMAAPVYHHSTGPPQQLLLSQHGALPSGQRVPAHPNPTSSAFPAAAAVPSQDPQVQQNSNPSTSGARHLYAAPLLLSQAEPAQAAASQRQPRRCTPAESSEYLTSEEEGGDEEVDTTPVRDSDSQNGGGGLADVLKAKPLSPEKTAKKVMTVKYLLGELKALVANQDSAAVQLINEVENSISLLPAMVGSTNIQAELALALQPLRSENAQLRRRLRILNQQLMERERAEREARPVDCDLEMTSLQSLNLSLQLQLREAHKEMDQVQMENKELRQAVEDKENELQLSRQQSEAETSRIKIDVSDALAEMRSCQSQLEASMVENAALSNSLQQREAEICRLQEVIRNFQGRLTASSMEHLEMVDVSKSNPQLKKKILEKHQQEQQSSCGSDSVSTSVKNYLQSMVEKHINVSPPRSRLSPPKTPTRPSAPWSGAGPSLPQERPYSPRRQGIDTLGQGGYSVGGEQRLDGMMDFAPMKEIGVAQGESRRPSARMDRSLDGSRALRSLSQIMERLALSARGVPFEDGSRPSHNTGASSLFSASVPPAPPRTCKQHVETGAKPLPTYTGRPSVMDSSLTSSPESLVSNSSMNSCSTFNTRDEEILRTGMDTLDATIARLQRTLEIDLKR